MAWILAIVESICDAGIVAVVTDLGQGERFHPGELGGMGG
jgi:hypothetical protein